MEGQVLSTGQFRIEDFEGNTLYDVKVGDDGRLQVTVANGAEFTRMQGNSGIGLEVKVDPQHLYGFFKLENQDWVRGKA